jgi:hypothetical protein
MSKIKLLITATLASAFVFLGGATAPISVFAEESAETHEISIESVVSEEVIEETESVENSAVLNSENKETERVEENTEKAEITYDDILALMGSIAEKEGFKDEWDKTLFYIQTAASEKKVDAMILLIVCVLVFLVIYSAVKIYNWYKKIKKDTTKKDIKDINGKLSGVEETAGAQTRAINELMGEEEKLAKEVHTANVEATEREKALARGIELQNVAIRCLIRGTNIKQDLKDEAFRALNESNDNCDKVKK